MAPTRSFQSVAPGRLQIREGGGPLVLFGLPFLAAGVFVTLIGLRVVPVTNAGEMPEFAWLLLPLVGLAFALVGGALAFGRSWTTIDTAQRTVIKEWGLLMPMRVRTHLLDGYSAVVLGFERGDSDTSDRFPVSLKSRHAPDLHLCSSTEYVESRSRAAAVAQHLNLEIEDTSTDHPTRLLAGQADLPLQHRLRLERGEKQSASRPSAARSEVSEEIGGVRIVIPLPRMHPVVVAAMLIPVAVPLVFLGPVRQFFRQTETPDPVAWIFLGFLTLAFGVVPAVAALNTFRRSRLGRTIVTVSTDGIRIEDRGAWRTRPRASFSASEILDVDYSTTESMMGSARAAEQKLLGSGQSVSGPPPAGPLTEAVLGALSRFVKGQGVTVKTRQGLTTFGQGLADDEIRYLHAVVRRALVALKPLGHGDVSPRLKSN